MRKKRIILIILIILIVLLLSFLIYRRISNKKKNIEPINITTSFDYDMIHIANNEESNYLISPFSIAYALSILKEGATNNTKVQIEKVLGNYNLKKVNNFENRIGLANALFIKDEYKNDIKETYINNIKDNYDGEILFDEFKTPDVINNWASEKTNKMINNVIDNIDKDYVLGIMNAIAIDVEWKYKFEGENTYKQTFNNLDNTKVNVDMMHSTNDIVLIQNEKAKGIIKDYNTYGDNELEFIAILPKDDIKEYINNFNKEELNSLLNNITKPSEQLDIKLTIPKFKYNYDYNNFKDDLISLGIKDAFDKETASFMNIETESSHLNLYVSEAVHKSVIDLNENGTKAAAITYFGLSKNTAIMPSKDVINIVFDKPFLYIIKDKNSDNIWFFGTVYNLKEN